MRESTNFLDLLVHVRSKALLCKSSAAHWITTDCLHPQSQFFGGGFGTIENNTKSDIMDRIKFIKFLTILSQNVFATLERVGC